MLWMASFRRINLLVTNVMSTCGTDVEDNAEHVNIVKVKLKAECHR